MNQLDRCIMRVAENIRDCFDENDIGSDSTDQKLDIVYDIIGDYTNSIPLAKLLLIAAEDTTIVTNHQFDAMDEGQDIATMLRTCLFMYLLDNINIGDFVDA